jgi:hypothetical protein
MFFYLDRRDLVDLLLKVLEAHGQLLVECRHQVLQAPWHNMYIMIIFQIITTQKPAYQYDIFNPNNDTNTINDYLYFK